MFWMRSTSKLLYHSRRLLWSRLRCEITMPFTSLQVHEIEASSAHYVASFQDWLTLLKFRIPVTMDEKSDCKRIGAAPNPGSRIAYSNRVTLPTARS